MDVLIYHGSDCNDGFCCAFLAKLAYPNVTCIPANYGDPPPIVTGLVVVIADFSYPRDVLLQMKQEAKSLLVFDHHKTAEKNCKGLDFCTFDMGECGASLLLRWLSWDWPWEFVGYIKDRDLWLKRNQFIEEFHVWLSAVPKTFEDWTKALKEFTEELNNPVPSWVDKGRFLLSAFRGEIVLAKARGWRQVVGGVEVPVVNNTQKSITSDLLHEMAVGEPFAASFYHQDKGLILWSLRSTEDGMDVSEIARMYGGGGHKHAAGFKEYQYPLQMPGGVKLTASAAAPALLG